jgi:peptidylprolyl isomerase
MIRRTPDGVEPLARLAILVLAMCTLPGFPVASAADAPAVKARTTAEILESSVASDWRVPKPEDLLYLDVARGRIVIELAPTFAPEHALNIRTLVRQKYFDRLAILRVQDNFVVQWGDPHGNRAFGQARETLPPEFTIKPPVEMPWTALPDADGFAPEAVQQWFSGGPRPRARRRVARPLLRHGGRRSRERAPEW